MIPSRPEKLYTGPQIPTEYDPKWGLFTNLGPQQIAAFQSFPQDLIKYATSQRWIKEHTAAQFNGVVVKMTEEGQRKIASVKQAFDAGAISGTVSFVTTEGGVHELGSTDIDALYAFSVGRVQATYKVLASVIAGANASPPTVTSRAQIDAAFAAIA